MIATSAPVTVNFMSVNVLVKPVGSQRRPALWCSDCLFEGLEHRIAARQMGSGSRSGGTPLWGDEPLTPD